MKRKALSIFPPEGHAKLSIDYMLELGRFIYEALIIVDDMCDTFRCGMCSLCVYSGVQIYY